MRKGFITSAGIDLRFSSHVPTGFYEKGKHIFFLLYNIKSKTLK